MSEINKELSIQGVIDKILCDISGGPKFVDGTCDMVSIGEPNNTVTGIVSTFMPTFRVLEETVRLGANFIISHEPTWFTGMDNYTEWCQNDSVYLAKKKYIEEHGLTIWRFHDHAHMGCDTDFIYKGLLKELDWEKYLQPDEKEPWVYEIPETTVGELAEYIKDRLEMEMVQIIGAPDIRVKRVGILVGGGSLGFGVEEMPMQVMERNNLDVMLAGDITEWTLCAYINDAYQMGMGKAMIKLGHERSEEAGMKHLVPWLKERFPGVPITFVDAREPWTYL